jgi:hypothetical protein
MSRTEKQACPNWTAGLRDRLVRTVPKGQWLPDRQPACVRSWIYVFGVACLAALIVVIGSGITLTVKGAAWWHLSALGHFVNSSTKSTGRSGRLLQLRSDQAHAAVGRRRLPGGSGQSRESGW